MGQIYLSPLTSLVWLGMGAQEASAVRQEHRTGCVCTCCFLNEREKSFCCLRHICATMKESPETSVALLLPKYHETRNTSVCSVVPDLLNVSLPAVSVLLEALEYARGLSTGARPLAPPDDEGLELVYRLRFTVAVGLVGLELRLVVDEYFFRNWTGWTTGWADACNSNKNCCSAQLFITKSEQNISLGNFPRSWSWVCKRFSPTTRCFQELQWTSSCSRVAFLAGRGQM